MSDFAFADSHLHLADAAFEADIEDVIARARAVGARALVCIGESPKAAVRAREIAERHPNFVFHTCGVHPHDAIRWDQQRDEDAIREAVELGAVAVGECGLDYHYDNSPREIQRKVLDAQVRIAQELNRPIVLHMREAEADTLAMLHDAGAANVRGVLHCYTGSHALAQAALDVGWYVSFSGIITFRSWTDLELLQMVPLSRLLVESDAPYLAPIPNRGKRNEPSWVPLTIKRLAEVRSVAARELATVTLNNTREFFDLPQTDVDTAHSKTTS